jgi:hypothetical protein
MSPTICGLRGTRTMSCDPIDDDGSKRAMDSPSESESTLSLKDVRGMLRIVKLSTGDELIGIYLDAIEERHYLMHPARLMYAFAPEVSTVLDVGPFTVTDKASAIAVPFEHVIYLAEVADDLARLYMTRVTRKNRTKREEKEGWGDLALLEADSASRH